MVRCSLEARGWMVGVKMSMLIGPLLSSAVVLVVCLVDVVVFVFRVVCLGGVGNKSSRLLVITLSFLSFISASSGDGSGDSGCTSSS